MITEIYVDNFRCLTNFRIKLNPFQLWLGDNGTGKSSVMDVLTSIQALLQGGHVADHFSGKSLTVWDTRKEQTFGVVLQIDDDTYAYQLTIEHSRQENKTRIKKEELKWNQSMFYLFDGQDVHLYRINRETGQAEEGTSFPADWSRSLIATVAQREDNWPLVRFRETMNACLLTHPVPAMMDDTAESEARSLSGHAENFAQWYRHVLQEKPGIGYKTKAHLADILPGFEQLSLKELGKSRRLTATFRINDREQDFDFNDLSDGQRQLLMLYTVLEALRAGIFSTVLIDEPDNFVSLREIQPWLDTLDDICEETGKQAIIISHHPEIVNKMARGSELWFSRQAGAHVVVKPFPKIADLPPSEVMARGWENE